MYTKWIAEKFGCVSVFWWMNVITNWTTFVWLTIHNVCIRSRSTSMMWVTWKPKLCLLLAAVIFILVLPFIRWLAMLYLFLTTFLLYQLTFIHFKNRTLQKRTLLCVCAHFSPNSFGYSRLGVSCVYCVRCEKSCIMTFIQNDFCALLFTSTWPVWHAFNFYVQFLGKRQNKMAAFIRFHELRFIHTYTHTLKYIEIV